MWRGTYTCHEYNKIQLEIEEETANWSKEHYAYRNEFEDLYFQGLVECEK